jgi:hypothetical protein
MRVLRSIGTIVERLLWLAACCLLLIGTAVMTVMG